MDDDNDNSMNLTHMSDESLSEAEAAMRVLNGYVEEAREILKDPTKYTPEQWLEAFKDVMRIMDLLLQGGQMLVEMEQVTRGEV